MLWPSFVSFCRRLTPPCAVENVPCFIAHGSSPPPVRWILPLGDARYVHTRLRTHAESVAFFGGDDVEGNICAKQYGELVEHQQKYLSAQWTHSIFDDFIIKQLPPIVTWVLTFAYVIRLAKVKDIYSDNGGQVGRSRHTALQNIDSTFKLGKCNFCNFGGLPR